VSGTKAYTVLWTASKPIVCGARSAGDGLETAHRLGLEPVDDTGIANCDIKMPESRVEEDDIRHATDRMRTPDVSQPRISHQ